MSPATFISDAESAVEALVEACQKPRASLEAPCLPHLIGRELVAFQDFEGPNPLDAPARKAPSKRKGSPQHAQGRPCSANSSKHAHKSKGGQTGGSSSESEVEARTPQSSARRAQPPKAQPPKPLSSPPRSASPPGVSSSAAIPMCPGTFRNSPKAELLPLPSSALLLRACLHAAAPPRLAVVA